AGASGSAVSVADTAKCNADGTLAVTPGSARIGATLTFTVTDQDLNTAVGTAQSVTVNISTGFGDTYAAVLTETGGADSGIFQISTSIVTGAVNGANTTLETVPGDTIKAVWSETSIVSGSGSVNHSTTAGVLGNMMTGIVNMYSDSGYSTPILKLPSSGSMYIEIVDNDANRNSSAVETFTIQISSTAGAATGAGNDDETVTMTESGTGTGVFRGTLALSRSRLITDGNNNLSVIEATGSDAVSVTYSDLMNSSGAVSSVVKIFEVNSDSTLEIIEATVSTGKTFKIRILDGDRDTTTAIDQFTITVTGSGGDSDTVTMRETGAETAIFEATVPVSLGSSYNNEGTVQCLNGETITARYVDSDPLISPVQVSLSDSVPVSTPLSHDGSIQITRDDLFTGVSSFAVGQTIHVVVNDPDLGAAPTIAVVCAPGGDTENLLMTQAGTSRYILSLRPQAGAANSGDGTLQVSDGDTVTIRYTDVIDATGNPNVSRSATVSTVYHAATVEFTDPGWSTAQTMIRVGGGVYLQVLNHDSNINTGILESITVTLESRNGSGTLIETVNLTLRESGVNSGLFRGSIRTDYATSVPGSIAVNDGYSLRASFTDPVNPAGANTVVAALVTARNSGIAATLSPAGASLQVSSASALVFTVTDPFRSGTASVSIEVSSLAGDIVNLVCASGAGNTFVSASMPVRYGTVNPSDTVLQVRQGDLVRVRYRDLYGENLYAVVATGASTTATIELPDTMTSGGPAVIQAGGTLRIRVTDPDVNTSASLETLQIALTAPTIGGDTLNVTLTETGPTTGIFEGSTQITHGAVTDPAVMEVFGSGVLTASYIDARDSIGNINQTRTATALLVNDGVVEIAAAAGSTLSPGESLTVTVRDSDLDTTAAADSVTVTIVSSMGDVEMVSLTETGVHTGIFQKLLQSGAGVVVDEPAGSEIIQVQPGDLISCTYVDAVSKSSMTPSPKSSTLSVGHDRLNNVSLGVVTSPARAGVGQQYQVTFFVTNTLPKNGIIVLEFPQGYDISRAALGAFAISPGLNFGGGSIGRSGTILSMIRAGDGDDIPAGNGLQLVFTDVVNPPAVGGSGSFTVRTTSSAGDEIDVSHPIPGIPIQASSVTMTSLAVTPPSIGGKHVVGQVGNLVVTFVTSEEMPADAVIKISCATDFDLEKITGASGTGINGTLELSRVGNVVVLKRNAGSFRAAGTTVNLVIAGVKNPSNTSAAGTLPPFQVAVYTSADALVETRSSVVPAVETGGTISSALVKLESVLPDTYTNAIISLFPDHQIPSDGSIQVNFPTGFDLTGISGVTSRTGQISGSISSGASGQIVTVRRSGGSYVSIPITDLVIFGVKTPPVSGKTADFSISTRTITNTMIDSITTVSGVTIEGGSSGSIALLDNNYSSSMATVVPGSLLYVQIIDADLNLNAGVAEIMTVTLRAVGGNNDLMSVVLTETANSTGVFRGTAQTAYAQAGVSGNSVLEIRGGDIITATYVDSVTSGGVGNITRTSNPVDTLIGATGVLQVTSYNSAVGGIAGVTTSQIASWEIGSTPAIGVRVTGEQPGQPVKVSVSTAAGDRESVSLVNLPVGSTTYVGYFFARYSKALYTSNNVVETDRASAISVVYEDALNGLGQTGVSTGVTIEATLTPSTLVKVSGDRQRSNEGILPVALSVRITNAYDVPVSNAVIEWIANAVDNSTFQPSIQAIYSGQGSFSTRSRGVTDDNGVSQAKWKIVKTDQQQTASSVFIVGGAVSGTPPGTASLQLRTSFTANFEAKQENIMIYSTSNLDARAGGVPIAEGLQFVTFVAGDSSAQSSLEVVKTADEIIANRDNPNPPWPSLVARYFESIIVFPPDPVVTDVEFKVEAKISKDFQDVNGNIIDGPEELNFNVSGAAGSLESASRLKEFYTLVPTPDTPNTFSSDLETIIRLPLGNWEQEFTVEKLDNATRSTSGNDLKLGVYRFTGVQWQLQEFLRYERYLVDPINNTYRYYINARSGSQFTVYTVAKAVDVNLAGSATELISKVSLDNNPFTPNGDGRNDRVTISFILGAKSSVTVKIFDSTGEMVRVLAKSQIRSSGYQAFTWDGALPWGETVNPGIYVFEIEAVGTADHQSARKTGMLGVVE
ncbi:MAG: hypothetical protein CVV64_08410, partial [Candidatus Wallbacteria bacterium HGW-Wallbacteria-1]